MSDAARLTRFRISQFTQLLRKTAEENDLLIKTKLLLTLAAVLLTGGAALLCTGAVIVFLVLPAVALLSPLLLVLSVLSLLYHKATRLWRRLSRSGNIAGQVWCQYPTCADFTSTKLWISATHEFLNVNGIVSVQNSSVVAEVGVWSVMSNRYRSRHPWTISWTQQQWKRFPRISVLPPFDRYRGYTRATLLLYLFILMWFWCDICVVQKRVSGEMERSVLSCEHVDRRSSCEQYLQGFQSISKESFDL